MHLDDEQIEKLASDVTDALREPMQLTRNDRRILPFLPLLVGTSRCKGDVNTKRWWSWENPIHVDTRTLNTSVLVDARERRPK